MITSEKVVITSRGLSGTESEFSEEATPVAGKCLLFNLRYLLFGSLLGIVFVKGEIISWYRIQEMFRFQSFHMYGVIGSAVITAMIAVFLIKKMGIRAADGSVISFPAKQFNKGQIFGGLMFGLGWAMTGACPGPLFAQIGTGALVVIVVLLSAIAGTWVYGKLKN
ncbi:MAG: DUF6691 family protein [Flavitalea sp.]